MDETLRKRSVCYSIPIKKKTLPRVYRVLKHSEPEHHKNPTSNRIYHESISLISPGLC